MPTPASIAPARLLAYAHNRAASLTSMARRFAARADADDPLRQVRSIERLAEHVQALGELTGLAHSAGAHDTADALEVLVDQAWTEIMEVAQAARQAIIDDLRRPAAHLPEPEVHDSSFGEFAAAGGVAA